MPRLFVFGLGYTASRLVGRLRARGWSAGGTTRTGEDGTVAFEDADRVHAEIAAATHVLSSVPPTDEGDPVLARYGCSLAGVSAWTGYLSSTGVYGDTGGAWVDESAPIGSGRRQARAKADVAWSGLGAHIFRLPGIYGPGRSPLDRIMSGSAHRVDLPNQLFSRIHVDDIVTGVMAGFDAPAGIYNLADDRPASQNAVIDFAARLIGQEPPPFVTLDQLTPMARGFYAENRRIANGKAKRVLGWAPAYPDYRAGLRALRAITSPISVNAPPPTASGVQR
ncbi:MAG TPA: NAD(P)-dependent oxidoreductase [Sphingomonas sp.]